jgi:hypothetical protein
MLSHVRQLNLELRAQGRLERLLCVRRRTERKNEREKA